MILIWLSRGGRKKKQTNHKQIKPHEKSTLHPVVCYVLCLETTVILFHKHLWKDYCKPGSFAKVQMSLWNSLKLEHAVTWSIRYFMDLWSFESIVHTVRWRKKPIIPVGSNENYWNLFFERKKVNKGSTILPCKNSGRDIWWVKVLVTDRNSQIYSHPRGI